MAKKAEFLSNKPLGEDLFDGQSQDKVAIALMQHILKVDAKPLMLVLQNVAMILHVFKKKLS